MALSSIQIARVGRMFVKKQAAWGVAETLAAANGCRHKSVTFPGSDNKNKRTIVEKQASPFIRTTQRTDGRTTAGLNFNGILRPSGVINTVPEVDPFLECAFGTKVNTVLSTTVTAASGVVGGATLASVAGLAVGGALLITCPDGKKRIRFIATLPGGAAVTWTPNLPAGQAPADAAAVKSALVYKLSTTSLLPYVTVGHYLRNLDNTAGFGRVCDGIPIDKLTLAFDANDDPMITATGPGRYLDTATAQAEPGGFTMVGNQPPSGITGEMMIGNTVAKFMKLQFDLTNAMKLRMDSYGYALAEEAYRVGRADIAIGLDMRAESESLLYDLAEAGTNTPLFKQTGFVEGNAIALRAANVEFLVPDTDDPEEEVNFPFKGMALESSEAALDGLVLALG